MTIKVEYLGVDKLRLNAIQQSATSLIDDMFATKDYAKSKMSIWPLMDGIWPARSIKRHSNKSKVSIKLTLVPLSRIGQMEGKSGSLVLIGCFHDVENPDIKASHPVVIKTAPVSKSKLESEFENSLAIRPFAYDNKDTFSIPFRKDMHDGFDVLWSLFSACRPIWSHKQAESFDCDQWKVSDLRDYLDEKRAREVGLDVEHLDKWTCEILKQTFQSLRNFHWPFGSRIVERRNIYSEYEWYLRGYGKDWGAEWKSVFGKATSSTIEYAGYEWTNPLWVIEKLKGQKWELCLGAVHGDLHAGNIIVTASHDPRIIDFGWAQDLAHVAKDFVLMECNLRFIFLKPQLSTMEVDNLTDWVGWGIEAPTDAGLYCKKRSRLIALLRQEAQTVMGESTDWDREYLVPLFLVAFGLLRFAPQLGNQQAAVLTVLSLATHVRSKLFR